MQTGFFQHKAFAFLYGMVLPGLTIFCIIGLASFNDHRWLLGSLASDLVLRVLIAAWFSAVYMRLSRFSSYSIYPNHKWTRSDVSRTEKIYLIGMSLFFGLACGLLTGWIVGWFFPDVNNFSWFFALINSVIIFLPMAAQYWVLKL